MARVTIMEREQVSREVGDILTEIEETFGIVPNLFVTKTNKFPHQITDEEFAELKNRGVSESEIIEALGVMELFTSFNKILNSLNVEIDFLNGGSTVGVTS